MYGRDALQSQSDEIQTAGSSQVTLAELAYKRLRQDIVTGLLAPGQPLRLELLKQRYGVSFTPLREALNRLQAERLVASVALRGFTVAPLSIEEMRDATETRILIECEALRRSIEYGKDAWETEIVSSFHSLDLQVRRMEPKAQSLDVEELFLLEARHQAFHRALISSCRSRRLLDLSDQLYAETQRYRLPTLAGNAPVANRDVAQEHRRIMEATLARTVDVAVALLADHYRKTSEFIEKHMS